MAASSEQLQGACLQEFLEGSLRSELCGERSRAVLRNRHGESVNVLLSAAPGRTAEGGFGGFVLMALEEHGERGNAVESAAAGSAAAGRLADLSRVVAQVAHEINNPLASVRNALRLMREQPAGLAMVDLNLPGNEKLELLRFLREQFPEVPMMVVTGHPSLPTAIASLRLRITHYLL